MCSTEIECLEDLSENLRQIYFTLEHKQDFMYNIHITSLIQVIFIVLIFILFSIFIFLSWYVQIRSRVRPTGQHVELLTQEDV